MKLILLCIFLFFTFLGNSQKIFFKSTQTYTTHQLEDLYASITLNNNILLFNAPDFNLYAYDKNTGANKWTYNLGWKSSVPPFFLQHYILANNSKEQVVQLDTSNGSLLKTMPFYNINSQPIIKDDILYTTGIYEAGNLIAYDLKKDTIAWYHFIAHGYEREPYYTKDKIWANSESDNWVELSYNGSMINTRCKENETELSFTNDCLNKFIALTHDGKPIANKIAKQLELSLYEQPEIIYSPGNTFILDKATLHTIGNKGKLKTSIKLSNLLPKVTEIKTNSKSQLLKADEEMVWMLYNDQYLVYNTKKKKLQKIIDLSAWVPKQGLLEGDNLWFISNNDGLLYGMKVVAD